MNITDLSAAKNFDNQFVPMRRDEIDPKLMEIISAVLDMFPDLPVSVRKIIAMAYDPKTCAREIASIASSDPVLVSNILKKVNSAYFSLDHKIENLNLAIVVLGFNEVRDIAVQCGLAKKIGKDGESIEYNTRDLWGHSYAVSICTEFLARDKKSKNTGILMTIAMLHDIGKFALYTIGMHARRMGMKARGMQGMSYNPTILEKEERLFGVTHPIVGSMLAEKWNLSGRISSVIECHHYPSFFPIEDIPEDYRESVAIISIADMIEHKISGTPNMLNDPDHLYFEAVGLPSRLEKILTPALQIKLENAKSFLNEIE
ncbi:MAG: HDOD domain-containing protein [Candidatus Latescibacteria bacterium]|nr:HDOD domain-containing protein [Candidatus Latescibacterota bacterium]